MKRQLFVVTVVFIGLFMGVFSHAQGVSSKIPAPILALPQMPEKAITDYVQLLTEFSKQNCPRRVREEFQDLFKRYRMSGFYVPAIEPGVIDARAIAANLPLLEKKLKWIQKLRANIESLRPSVPPQKNKTHFSWPAAAEISTPLLVRIQELLEYKKEFQVEKKSSKKSEIRKKSARALMQLRNEFQAFAQKIPFLLSFQFPIDHLKNRLEYEKFRKQKNVTKANRVFFKRQIFEDGALDPDHSASDIYIRTTLDTIGIELGRPAEFLDEAPRYDLEWVLGLIKKNINRGPEAQIARMKEWEERIESELTFYRGLLASGAGNKPTIASGSGSKQVDANGPLRASGKAKDKKGSAVLSAIATKAKATADLRDFVYRKQAATYEFFSKQSELTQVFFAFDQVLLNEVGAADEANYRDRRDVGQVVINRRYHSEYSDLDKTDPLRGYLKRVTSLKETEIKEHRWLNVMLKEDEFSFTLFLMPAVENVFCPDLSKIAADTRQKNLWLALDLLKKPNREFRALRYFSRFSMIGKIDMAQMWDGFIPIPQQPGRPLTLSAQIRNALQNSLYRYLYRFTGQDGQKYHVVEIDKRSYVVSNLSGNADVYSYRNPHQFKFFEENDNPRSTQR